MKHIIHCLILFPLLIGARTVDYQLTIAQKNITIKGKTSTALAINDSIPSPTLYFNEGDVARIEVRNNLKNEPTSLHWHGLLLPNDQDGVPFLTTPQINPGSSLTYHFPLTHPGTYWYHSHAGLQEQRGLYGAIVVRPKKQSGPTVDRDYVVVLSDFTHENPSLVMRTLMRGSSNYAIRKGSMQSITGAIRAGSLADYWARENHVCYRWMCRTSPMMRFSSMAANNNSFRPNPVIASACGSSMPGPPPISSCIRHFPR